MESGIARKSENLERMINLNSKAVIEEQIRVRMLGVRVANVEEGDK